MSSVLVGELKEFLNNYPNDWKVIMRIFQYNAANPSKPISSIAYINGIKGCENRKEIELIN